MSATLSDPQTKWLEALVPPQGGRGKPPVVGQSDAAKAKLALRTQVLAQVAAAVDKLKPDLIKALKDYKIEKGGKVMPLHADTLNPDDSISVKGDLKDTGGKDDPKLLGDAKMIVMALEKAHAQLLVQQDVLRSAGMDDQGQLVQDGTGELLFTESDIQRELWTPLVREGIMPEDQVIDRFSEMAQTFKGAQNAYAERLQAFGETAEPEADGGLLGAIAGGGAAVLEKVGQFTSLAGTVLPELSDKVADRKWVEGMKETTGLAIAAMQASSLALKGAEALLTRKDGIDIAEHFVKAVGPVTKLLPVSKDLQETFPKACSALLGSGKFLAKLLAGDYAAAGNAAGDAIGDAMEVVGKAASSDLLSNQAARTKGLVKSLVASAVLVSKRSASRDEVIGAWESVAKEVGGVLIGELGTLKKEGQETERGQIGEGLQRALDRAKDTIETVTDICLNVPDIATPSDESDDKLEAAVNDCATRIEELAETYDALRKEKRGDQVGPLTEKLQQQIDEINRQADALRIMRDTVNEKLQQAYKNKDDRTSEDEDEDEEEPVQDPGGWDKAETLKKLKAAKAGLFPAEDVLAQVEAQALAERMDEETAAFARSLRDDMVAPENDPSMGGRLELQKIEALIDKMKLDKAYVKIGLTLADLGAKAGAKWLETLGPLATLKDMMVNVYAAYQRLDEIKKWKDAVQDSRNAGAYALVAAQLNRAGIEESAFKQDTIKSVLKAAQLVGDGLKLSGIAGLFGAALSAASQGGEIGRGVITQFFSAREMNAAWDAYQRALQNPGDRKLEREALRSNATLAKYALAWAAVDGGNALAREAMRKCGLNDQVLGSKDTDAQKVVKYLETMFDEDPIVLRASPPGQDWWPGTPELTARNWTRFSSAAAKADPPLDANSAVLVTKALAKLDTLLPAALANRKDETVVAPARLAVAEVRTALRGYHPLDADRRAHAGMQAYADAMAALAELTASALPDANP